MAAIRRCMRSFEAIIAFGKDRARPCLALNSKDPRDAGLLMQFGLDIVFTFRPTETSRPAGSVQLRSPGLAKKTAFCGNANTEIPSGGGPVCHGFHH